MTQFMFICSRTVVSFISLTLFSIPHNMQLSSILLELKCQMMYNLPKFRVDITLNVKMSNDKPMNTTLRSAEFLCICKIKLWWLRINFNTFSGVRCVCKYSFIALIYTACTASLRNIISFYLYLCPTSLLFENNHLLLMCDS